MEKTTSSLRYLWVVFALIFAGLVAPALSLAQWFLLKMAIANSPLANSSLNPMETMPIDHIIKAAPFIYLKALVFLFASLILTVFIKNLFRLKISKTLFLLVSFFLTVAYSLYLTLIYIYKINIDLGTDHYILFWPNFIARLSIHLSIYLIMSLVFILLGGLRPFKTSKGDPKPLG